MDQGFKDADHSLERIGQQRWQREDTLRLQLRELEDQMWRDSLPDWQRQAIEATDRKRPDIKREARRRLGLPEEG
jgi:hypothetical protein